MDRYTWTHKADEPVNPPSLPWHIFPHSPWPLPDPNTALISLLHTLCNHGNCLTLLVVEQWCATSSFLRGSLSTFAQSCRKIVSGDNGNNVVQNQTSSTANMMTLNSHCTVPCVEAIKLRLVFLKQIEMYHTSVVLSFIDYTWERIWGGIDRLLF